MNTVSVQVTYRSGEPFAAYIYLGQRPGLKVVRTEEVGPDLLIDYASDDAPVGIEIVSPGYVTVEEIVAAFRKLGLTPPAPKDLAPLRAA
jgi:uncharacterized protein YuzE